MEQSLFDFINTRWGCEEIGDDHVVVPFVGFELDVKKVVLAGEFMGISVGNQELGVVVVVRGPELLSRVSEAIRLFANNKQVTLR